MACFQGLDQWREPNITMMNTKENSAQLDGYCRQKLCAISYDKRHFDKEEHSSHVGLDP